MTRELYDVAGLLHEKGWRPVPLYENDDGGLRPIIAGEVGGWTQFRERQMADFEIEYWFRERSDVVGIGVITGKDTGLLGLDLDQHGKGKNGFMSLDQQEIPVPKGPTIGTPRMGEHILLAHPGAQYSPLSFTAQNELLPGVEIHGDGKLFIVYGPGYELVSDFDTPLPELEGKLRELVLDGTAENPVPDPTSAEEDHQTDLGNARRLVAAHGQDLRYCIGRKAWYVWDGRRWAADETGEVVRRAKDTVRRMYAEALGESEDDRRRKLLNHALSSESASKIRAMVELAQTEPGIPVVVEELDADPWVLNCENGTLDLKTLELRDHRREDLCTRITSVPYETGAKNTKWDRFLRNVIPDEDVRAFVQRAAGYSMTGDDSDGNVLILQGPTHTGKTTILESIKATLGGYAITMEISSITRSQHGREPGRARSDLVRLFGARFVSSTEAPDNMLLDEARVKQLTGGDKVVARALYAEEKEESASWTLWIGTNHRPRVNNADDAVWNRLVELPFEQQHLVPDKKLRPYFLRSRRAQGAILAWMVEGLRAYHEQGLGPPDAVKEATEEYRQQMNPLFEWVKQCCVLDPKGWAATGRLRRSYEEFAGRYPVSSKNWSDSMLWLPGVKVGKRYIGTKQRRVYVGIRLLRDDDDMGAP